jgi:hypothetical protein
MSGVSKPYSELYSPVRNDAPKSHLWWRFALKSGAVQNWLKHNQNKLFSDGIKKLMKRWNRCVEVEEDYVENNNSFVSVYLQYVCFFFWKAPYFLTYPCKKFS